MKSGSKLALLAFAGAHAAFASLIPIGPVPTSGSGLGNVLTALTFASPGSSSTETGCVGAGIGGVKITGPAACPAGVTGGNEQAINNTYSAMFLGLTGATDFDNLQLIFNASEPGNAADMGIVVDKLVLTLWSPTTGALLASYSTAGPYVILDAFPGTGNAGYGFVLDAAQAAAANAVLTANSNLYVGVASNASLATGGLETVFLRVNPAETGVIPEPATFALAGLALTSLALLRRRSS
ncbi:MAG: PEP-CTERM sorting domain-containing protein [Bryobacteraceae bacterium]